jgi:hypothetical protein
MAMREQCKHFQSRTYDNGEVARFCVLGNAPDQPWSCPEECLTYEPRLADVGWAHGSLARRPAVEQPPAPDVSPEDRREILDAASAIVESVAPQMFEERRRQLDELAKGNRRGWKFWRR